MERSTLHSSRRIWFSEAGPASASVPDTRRSGERVEQRRDQGFLGHRRRRRPRTWSARCRSTPRARPRRGRRPGSREPATASRRPRRACGRAPWRKPGATAEDRRGGRDDGRATGEQATHDRAADGCGAHAGDHCDVVRVGQVVRGRQRVGCDLLQASGAVVIALGAQAVRPVRGLIGHVRGRCPRRTRPRRAVPSANRAGDVLTSGGPAVIQQDGARGVEARLDQVDPARTELGVDGGRRRVAFVVLAGFGGRSRSRPAR